MRFITATVLYLATLQEGLLTLCTTDSALVPSVSDNLIPINFRCPDGTDVEFMGRVVEVLHVEEE